ncbi:hypothetical protein ES703_41895 [subsurface metagenome]
MNLLLAQWLTVGGTGAGLIGTAVADNGFTDYQAGATALLLSHADGRIDTGYVHAVDGADDMPAVGLETPGHILGEGDVGVSLNRDVIVVVQVNKLAQAQCPGQ